MEVFADQETASKAAAGLIIQSLAQQLQARPRASLMLSGGNTPQRCMCLLSQAELPWERVDVTLTDEREVAAHHPQSNERMLRETLLTAKAKQANFVKLDSGQLHTLYPFASTLVGMGEDGHFASLFPDSAQLDDGLFCQDETIRVQTPSSTYSRISATLSTLCASKLVILLVYGANKRHVLESPGGYPIEHLLAQTAAPLRIFWAR